MEDQMIQMAKEMRAVSWNDTDVKCTDIEGAECALLKVTKPSILIKKNCMKKLKFMLNKYKALEWMALLVGNCYHGRDYVVNDICIIDQEVAGATVEATALGREQMVKVKAIGWIHSHNTMKAFASNTDIDTAANFDLSMTINNDFEFAAKAREKFDCPHLNEMQVIRDADVFLEQDEYNMPELDAECNEKIHEKVWSAPVTNFAEAQASSIYKDEVCHSCGKAIKEDEVGYCMGCGADMHISCVKEKTYCKYCIDEFGNWNDRVYARDFI